MQQFSHLIICVEYPMVALEKILLKMLKGKSAV